MNELGLRRDFIDVFGGYNHNLRIPDGDFYDMGNMTSDYYPLLASRERRAEYVLPDVSSSSSHIVHRLRGMIEKDALWYVDGTDLYCNNSRITGVDVPYDSYNDYREPVQMVGMGAYIIMFPYGVYVNTLDTNDHGCINAYSDNRPVNCSFCMCDIEGRDIQVSQAGGEAPSDPSDGYTWIDTSGKAELKRWYEASSMWVSETTSYVKISRSGIGLPFEVGDAVLIKGIRADKELSELLNGKCSVIQAKSDDYIVVIGILESTGSVEQSYDEQDEQNNLAIRRFFPKMDFVCESGNRLWGCRYGKNLDGVVVNEIYASKLGDFKNWNVFTGVSTDSYYASVGTDGAFTGAVSYLGRPIFFKENWCHTVYGSYPAQFQINATSLRGVQKGCSGSLAIVDETLFYKSRSGVMAFGGSLPSSVSEPLGSGEYDGAVGASFGSKYYVSMRCVAENKHYLFVYDTARGMWHKEDSLTVREFCKVDNTLYAAVQNDPIEDTSTSVYEIANPTSKLSEGAVQWFAESGCIGLSAPDKKYLARIDLRMTLDPGALARILVQYDSLPGWEQTAALNGIKLSSFTVPIKPRRCDHMRIRIEGRGGMKLYSVCKITEQGSDV